MWMEGDGMVKTQRTKQPQGYDSSLTFHFLVLPLFKLDAERYVREHCVSLYPVSLRFPALSELAQQQVKQLNKPEELDRLVEQAVTAPDEATARWLLLGSPTA